LIKTLITPKHTITYIMNLWAKRTGQLLVAVLFLMSCENDSFLLGFKNQSKQFNVRYHEFTFTDGQTSVMLLDSLITDHYSLASGSTFRLLMGQYIDPALGTVRSEVYTQFFPLSTNQMTGVTLADYEYATVQFKLDFYYYGGNVDSQEKFTIHELTENLSTYKRYFYNSSLSYDPTPLGEATIDVRNFALREVANPDTLLITAQIDDEYAFRLFQYAMENDSLGNPAFLDEFKGFAIVPSSGNKYILGIDPRTTLSKLTLHYHKGAQKLERSFWFSPTPVTTSFNKISTARTGDLAAITQPYEPYSPASELCYVQSGSPVVTKLDLTQYYDFIRGDGPDGEDSLKKILINSAEISIGIEPPPVDLPPPSTLLLRVLRKVNDTEFLPMNSIHDADSTDMSGFRLAYDGPYYVATGDASAYLELTYNKTEQRYLGRPSLFLQNLFDRKEVDVDVAQFAIFPVSQQAGKSVNRVVFKQDDIKLGIYYTKINLPNLE
jgi:hypothetical protein